MEKKTIGISNQHQETILFTLLELTIKLQFIFPEPYMVLLVKMHHKPPNYFSLYNQTSESSLPYWDPNYFKLVQLRFLFEVLFNRFCSILILVY